VLPAEIPLGLGPLYVPWAVQCKEKVEFYENFGGKLCSATRSASKWSPYWKSTPQNSSGAFCNSSPSSQPVRPSCPRQIRIASQTLWFTRLITRSRWPTGNPCGTTARQPFVLVSAVQPSARRVWPFSSHSTAIATRALTRTPARTVCVADSKLDKLPNATVVSWCRGASFRFAVRIERSRTALCLKTKCSQRKRGTYGERTAPVALRSMELPCQFAVAVTPLPRGSGRDWPIRSGFQAVHLLEFAPLFPTAYTFPIGFSP